MQNLTTTLIGDIKDKRKVILPSGDAKFNWIDTENNGEAGAIILNTGFYNSNQLLTY